MSSSRLRPSMSPPRRHKSQYEDEKSLSGQRMSISRVYVIVNLLMFRSAYSRFNYVVSCAKSLKCSDIIRLIYLLLIVRIYYSMSRNVDKLKTQYEFQNFKAGRSLWVMHASHVQQRDWVWQIIWPPGVHRKRGHVHISRRSKELVWQKMWFPCVIRKHVLWPPVRSFTSEESWYDCWGTIICYLRLKGQSSFTTRLLIANRLIPSRESAYPLFPFASCLTLS